MEIERGQPVYVVYSLEGVSRHTADDILHIRAIVSEVIANRPPRKEEPTVAAPQIEQGPDGAFIVRLPAAPTKS